VAATLTGKLAERLRDRIESGELPPGALLPAERALADAESVSRVTARNALRILVQHGLIAARHGVGYAVRADVRLRWIATDSERGDELGGPAPNDSWSRQVRLQGHKPGETIVAVEHVPASERQAADLDVEPGTMLLARRRIRYVDGRPHMIADSYYLAGDVAGTPIELPGDVQPGVFKIFEKMGRPWGKPRRDLTIARMPTASEADALGIDPIGTPVIELTRISRDRAGTPVRLSVFVGHKLQIEHNYEEQQ